MPSDRRSIENPLLTVKVVDEDEQQQNSRCPACCLFPVISPSENNLDARLHGTLLKDIPSVSAVLVTLGVLVSIFIGLTLRYDGASAPVINVNLGQFNMIAALMLLTWFGWGYATCSKFFYDFGINYVVILNLGSPLIDPLHRERYLSALGVARLTAIISLLQGVSLALCIVFWRYSQFEASSVVVLLVFGFHLLFLLFPGGFERDSRLALRTTLLRCFAAPFFHVLFLDVMVGDVLTSCQGNFSRFCPFISNRITFICICYLSFGVSGFIPH
jgi:hypothetical protein